LKDENTLYQTIIKIIKEDKPETIEQLVSLAEKRVQIPKQKILESILKMQSEGKISFGKPQQAVTDLAAYLKTEQTLWYWATLATSIITVIVVFAIPENLYPLVYIRYGLGSIFVLWLPGYAFIKALFPTENSAKTSEKGLDMVERIALSLGMSLALVPLVGLLLNYTPWGIRLAPIVLSLLALTIVFATAALIREYNAETRTNE
jgi:uncharacterized membrane protein